MEDQKQNKSGRAVFFTLFALIFIRYCYYGFTYFPQLDDYIQYHNYRAYSVSLWGVVQKLGLLASRPLAGLFDLYFWSLFFSVMIVAVALISLCYAASGCLLQRVFARHFGTGNLFLVVFCLLPLGFEGTYWVSASSRIIVGLFFASLSLYGFQRWCEGTQKRWLALFWVCQLMAFGFYEQVLVFAVAATGLVFLLNIRKQPQHTLFGLLTFANAALYFAFTHLAGNSMVYDSRIALVFPWHENYCEHFLPQLMDQLKTAFVSGFCATLKTGFMRGCAILWQDGNFLYIVAILALCVYFFYLTQGTENGEKTVLAVIVGLLLAVAPVTPFFILDNTWLSLRGTVPSFCGIALVADAIFSLMRKNKPGRTVFSVLTAIMALAFCIASVSELHDYRLTTLADERVTGAVLKAIGPEPACGKDGKIAVLNVEPTYLQEMNLYYHEHIHGVTESNWAFTGALRCFDGNGSYPTVYPLSQQVYLYAPYNAEDCRLDTFDELYYYDNVTDLAFAVSLQKTGEHAYDILDESGAVVAKTWEEDGFGYMGQQD